ncbi:MAG: PEP-CTERM sorting domain-containing protein [Anaerohalosphaera sp.]|nr:PEP-CTERM sorting domain-containing protein [Anaerohalosphaera sp.]
MERKVIKRAMFCVVLMMALALSNAAMALTVTNAGFEEPDMSGEDTPFTWWSPDGWTGVGGVEETRDARYGTLIEGNQVAYINIGGTPGTTASVTSDICGQIVADTTYTLTIAIAQRIKADGSAWDSNPDGEIGLLVGGVPVGTFTAYEGGSCPLGSFTDITYTWTAPGVGDALIGQDIQVQMDFTYDEQGATLGWQQAQFDNVRLIPEPASLSLLALGGLSLIRRKK